MKKFLTYLKENDFNVDCFNCKKRLYKYTKKNVTKENIIYSKDFKPFKDIPQPKPGEAMQCPFCKTILVHMIPMYGE